MENPTIPPETPSPSISALENMRAIASEHFDSFLIVTSKEGVRYSGWKDDDSAFGMASFVVHNINKKWWESNSKI